MKHKWNIYQHDDFVVQIRCEDYWFTFPKQKQTMNILITDAFGFVGTNLSKPLSTTFNHRLIAVDVSEPERHNYSEYISWDKLHTPGKKKIDAIIHLAGNTEKN